MKEFSTSSYLKPEAIDLMRMMIRVMMILMIMIMIMIMMMMDDWIQ